MLRFTLQEISADLESFITKLDDLASWGWTPAFIVLPYVFCSSLLIIGVLMAWMEMSHPCFRFLQTWIILPIFSLLTGFCWIVACIVGSVATLNADLCMSGEDEMKGPEMSLVQLLHERGVDEDGLLYKIISYFTLGCQSANPFDFVDKYQHDLNEAVKEIQSFRRQVNHIGVESINELCGSDVQPLVNLLLPLSLNLVELLQYVGRTLSLISCQRIHQIFVKALYGAVCTHSVDALIWAFVTLVLVSFCGMIVATLRASWSGEGRVDYNRCYVDEEEEDETEDDLVQVASGKRKRSKRLLKKKARDAATDGEESYHSLSDYSHRDDGSSFANDEDLFPSSKRSM